ncbi:unnamed protein product, partial [Polarella glacialis]
VSLQVRTKSLTAGASAGKSSSGAWQLFRVEGEPLLNCGSRRRPARTLLRVWHDTRLTILRSAPVGRCGQPIDPLGADVLDSWVVARPLLLPGEGATDFLPVFSSERLLQIANLGLSAERLWVEAELRDASGRWIAGGGRAVVYDV